MTVITLVERLDLPALLSRARSRRDTKTDTVQFAQAALAAAKREGLQLAVRARYACRSRHWPIPGALSSRSERGPPFFGRSA